MRYSWRIYIKPDNWQINGHQIPPCDSVGGESLTDAIEHLTLCISFGVGIYFFIFFKFKTFTQEFRNFEMFFYSLFRLAFKMRRTRVETCTGLTPVAPLAIFKCAVRSRITCTCVGREHIN
jgi:hypothetical protein